MTSSTHSNLGLFYNIRWWAEVPYPIKVNACLVAVSPPAPDDDIHSRRKLRPYADGEISCILIRAFTLLVSDSYGHH